MIRRMVLRFRIRRLLKSLGKRPAEVAQSLRNRNIKGGWSSLTCPIATLITLETGTSVHVSEGYISDRNFRPLAKTPQPVREFIDRYDHGLYRDLLQALPKEK